MKIVICAALVALAAACASNSSEKKAMDDQAMAMANPAQAAQATAPQPPTDGEIAAIVLAANDADVAAGKQAQAKTKNPDVKAFADRMVIDHTGVNDKAKEVATKQGITPQPDATSEGITKNAAATREKMDGLSGDAFDKAYVGNEISYHTMVISALDEILIPNAKNPELKNLLVSVRPAFVDHLEHAKQLMAKLSAANPG